MGFQRVYSLATCIMLLVGTVCQVPLGPPLRSLCRAASCPYAAPAQAATTTTMAAAASSGHRTCRGAKAVEVEGVRLGAAAFGVAGHPHQGVSLLEKHVFGGDDDALRQVGWKGRKGVGGRVGGCMQQGG